MRKTGLVLILFLLPLLAHAAPVGEVEIRSVFPLTPPQLERLAALTHKDAEAAELLRALEREGLSLLRRTPSPLKVIHYEGLVHTDPRRIEAVKHLEDMDDLACLLEWWQATADPRALQQGLRYIRDWSGAYQPTGNDVNENKLQPIIVAAISWRGHIPEEEWPSLAAWLQKMGDLHLAALKTDHDKLTNRFTKRLHLVATIGMALGQQEWLNDVRAAYRDFVAGGLFADGSSEDLRRRDTLTYHCSMLRPLLDLAQLLNDPALYKWESPTGSSVKKSVDYVIPYADGSKQRQEWLNTTVELDRKRAAAGLEEYRPGRLFDPAFALPMLEQASFFDDSLLPLVIKLSATQRQRFPTWRSVLNAAAR
jgi:hypothetical protein